jgi:hypothetical protein
LTARDTLASEEAALSTVHLQTEPSTEERIVMAARRRSHSLARLDGDKMRKRDGSPQYCNTLLLIKRQEIEENRTQTLSSMKDFDGCGEGVETL